MVLQERGAQPYRWLEWAREIQALAQIGQHYSTDHFNQERYERLSKIAAEIIAEHTEPNSERLARIFQEQIGYATPRVDVRGAVFQERRMLMVKERQDGGWTMPGGWADVGNVPSDSVEREVWEEAGFRVKTRKVVGVYDANRIEPLDIFHAYKIVFLCEILSGEPRISNETSEVAFFSLDDIPETLSGERTHLRHIQDAFHAYANPDCPTVFD